MNRNKKSSMEEAEIEMEEAEIEMVELDDTESGTKKKKKPKKKLPNWVILPIIGGVVLIGVVGSKLGGADKRNNGQVEVVKVMRGDVKEVYNTSGTVDSEKKKIFYSPVNAKVSDNRAKVGKIVKAGEMLVTFDTTDLEQNNQKMELDLQSVINTNRSTVEQTNRSASEAEQTAADAQAASDAAREQSEQQIAALEASIAEKQQMMSGMEAQIAQENAAYAEIQPQVDALNGQKQGNEARINVLYGEINQIREKLNEDERKREELEQAQKEGAGEGNPALENSTAGANGGLSEKDLLSDAERAQMEAEIDVRAKEIEEKKGTNEALDVQLNEIGANVQTGSQEAYAAAAQEVAALQSQLEQLWAAASASTPSSHIPDTSLTAGQWNNMQISENLAQLALMTGEELVAKGREGIKAEFDGIIADVKTVEGQTAMQGGELFTLVSNRDVAVHVEVSANDFDKLQTGSQATIKVGKHTYNGVVESVDKIALPNAKGNPVISAKVKIANPDDNIYIGVTAKLTMVVAEEKDVLYLPSENVNTSTEGDFVYVVQNGTVKKKGVELGISSNSKVEIKSGLEEGDQVVVDTLGSVQEGMKVTGTVEKKVKDVK